MSVLKRRVISLVMCVILIFSCSFAHVILEVSAQEVLENNDNTNTIESNNDSSGERDISDDTNEVIENQDSEVNNLQNNDDNQIDESDIIGKEAKLNYFYIESPYLETPAEQNLVISIGDGTENITSAILVYQREDGIGGEWTEYKREGNLFHFCEEFEEDESGKYMIVAVEYIQDDVKHSILLEDIGIEAEFGVNTICDGIILNEENSSEITEDIETSVAVVNSENVKEIDEKVEDTITETEKNVSATTYSLKSTQTASKAKNLVVVLDPGHGGDDGGAAANGLVEKYLTLSIAQYCKKELETYNGVTVYMTRESDINVGLSERVQMAKNWGADVFVSIHINSAISSSAEGAEVWYPNSSYNLDVYNEGKELADSVQQELVKLGLFNRTIKVRNSENGTVYADGSIADYYSVIRDSKLNGFPGIIVEHAFISNPNEANKLKQESFLEKLGIADATGIAKAYNLVKGNILNIGQTIFDNYDPVKGTFDIVVGKINAPAGVSEVLVQVGCDSGMSLWKKAEKVDENTYKTTINIAEFDYFEGNYYAQAYLYGADVVSDDIITKNVITCPGIAETKIENIDLKNGRFDVVMTDVSSLHGISSVCVSAYCSGTSTQWYTAEKISEGVYKATIDISRHNNTEGTYIVQGYARDNNGILGAGDEKAQEIKYSAPTIKNTEINNVDLTQGTFDVILSGITADREIHSVCVAAYCPGTSTQWYIAEKVSEGVYKTTIDIVRHDNKEGIYTVQGYVRDSAGVLGSGESKFQKINLSSPTIEKTTIENYHMETGTFDVVLSGVTAGRGIQSVCVSAYCSGSSTQWYTAEKVSEGIYKATIDASRHNNVEGVYEVQGYVRDNKGMLGSGSVMTQKVNLSTPTVEKTEIQNYDAVTGTFDVVLSGVTAGRGVQSVCVSAYCPGTMTQWYTAEKVSEGVYKVTVDISRHENKEGVYEVQGYVRDNKGVLGSGDVKKQKVSISIPIIDSTIIMNYNAEKGTFDVVLNGVTATREIKAVSVAVDCVGIATQWYVAEKVSDGIYKATVDISRHGYKEGIYTVQGYVRDISGALGTGIAMTQKVYISMPTVENTEITNYNEATGTFDVILSGVSAGRGIQSVSVSAYCPGIATQWYVAEKISEGVYKATIDISRHEYKEGIYTVQGYVRDKQGNLGYGDSKVQTVRVTEPVIEKISVENQDNELGILEILLTGVSAPKGVGSVCVSAFVEGTGTQWYSAEKESDGVYKATIEFSRHKYKTGTYHIQGYVRDALGVLGSSEEIEYKVSGILNLIMGESTVSVEELERFYISNSIIDYPAEELSAGGVCTLRQFCQLYYDEAKTEGIRVEVAFAQAMLETGYLAFGGDVKINQFNFAGMGATGNGNPGNSFSTVQEGIRAQIQHLKCYASTEPLNNPCVDPRWGEWLRGKAPYVEWLSIPNNPNGTGWASDSAYGEKLKIIINKIQSN